MLVTWWTQFWLGSGGGSDPIITDGGDLITTDAGSPLVTG